MSDELDFSGSRRLTGGEEWFWYLFAGATYIVAGIWHKWILNWLMGPIWLVTIVVVGPWMFDRARDLVGRAGSGGGVVRSGDDRTTGDGQPRSDGQPDGPGADG